MSLSFLLQQCPTCLVCRIWMVLEIGGKYPYSCCFVGCCFLDLFSMAPCILVQFPSMFFSICLVGVHMVHPCSRNDTTVAWKKLHFILSDRSDFNMIDNLFIAVYVFISRILMSFSVDEILLLRYMKCSENHYLEWRCLLFD